MVQKVVHCLETGQMNNWSSSCASPYAIQGSQGANAQQLKLLRDKDLLRNTESLVTEVCVRGVSLALFVGCFGKVISCSPISAGFFFSLLWHPLLPLF